MARPKDETRTQKFIELMASGKDAYPACIAAGYSPTYAKSNSHIMREKYKNEIAELKPIAKLAIQEEFKYTVKDSFKKLNEIQELALMQDDKGNFNNLGAAIKAEELKGRMYGVYEADNTQKAAPELNITVTRKD